MKVIHFIASIDKVGGGTTEYMRLLSLELKNHLEIIIATGNSNDPIEINEVPVKFFDISLLRWSTMIKEFTSFLKVEKPDILHINGIWSPENWGFQLAAQKLGFKVIVSPHGMLEPWILNNNPIKKKIALFLYQKKAIQQCDYLLATAELEAENIRVLNFKNPIFIIPNGIDSKEVKQVKSQYGTRKMVFLSRIHPKKGIELLLEAWRNCDTKDWQLEIAGNGDEKYIANLALSAQDLKNVQFVGAQYGEDKWDFLRSADVMVLPTFSENFGIVVAEALAVGVPVMTTKGTPWSDLQKYQCGWWIDLSVSNLEKTLIEVFTTPSATLEIMGINGKKLVSEKYDIKAIGLNMVEFYKNVLK